VVDSADQIKPPAISWLLEAGALPRRAVLWEKGGHVCFWCKSPTHLRIPKPDGTFNLEAWDLATIDHVVPRHRGGTNDDSNLVCACRLCNNRRAHEDMRGLPEGSLLGDYFPRGYTKKSKANGHVALTGDEKKQIMAGTYIPSVKRSREDVLLEQRDQALSALNAERIKLKDVAEQLAQLREEHKFREAVVQELDERIKSMSIWRLLRVRLAEWMRPK
jgi:hypothetical protein